MLEHLEGEYCTSSGDGLDELERTYWMSSRGRTGQARWGVLNDPRGVVLEELEGKYWTSSRWVEEDLRAGCRWSVCVASRADTDAELTVSKRTTRNERKVRLASVCLVKWLPTGVA